MSIKEKIYLNGIPVYRTGDLNEACKYTLFENNDNGHVLFISNVYSRDDEYKIVIEAIQFLVTPNYPKNELSLKVNIIEYEQNRRSNEWLLKPSERQIGIVAIRNNV